MEDKIVDLNIALKASAGNEKLARDLLSLFIEQSSSYQDKIKQALDTQDYTQLQQALHKLHGALQYLGVPKLATTISAIDGQLEEMEFNEISLSCHQIFIQIQEISQAKGYP